MPRSKGEASFYTEKYYPPEARNEDEDRKENAVREPQIHWIQKKWAPGVMLQKLCDYVVWKSQHLIGQLSNQGNLIIATLSDPEQRKKIAFQILWGRKGLSEYEKNRATTADALVHARSDVGNFNL